MKNQYLWKFYKSSKWNFSVIFFLNIGKPKKVLLGIYSKRTLKMLKIHCDIIHEIQMRNLKKV